jgi:HK97 family phage prohead protease
MKIEKRNFEAILTKADEENKELEFTFSTGKTDRMGERIDQETWDLKNFKKNPVILFAHDNHNIVVGNATKVGLDEKNNLVGKIKFAIEEGIGVYGDLIKTLYNLYKNKFMRAVSVGFSVGETKEDKTGIVLQNNELLEISLVPVPANAQALAKEKGLDISALDKLDEVEKEKGVKFAEIKENKIEVKEAVSENTEKPEEKEIKEEPKEVLNNNIHLDFDYKENKLYAFKDKEKIGEVMLSEKFKNNFYHKDNNKVVTESQVRRKEELSPKGVIKAYNKAIRKLLKQKQRIRSN